MRSFTRILSEILKEISWAVDNSFRIACPVKSIGGIRCWDYLIYLITLKNLAFIATITVLKDIRAAPTAGLKIIPNGNKTPAANGIANRL